MAQTMNVLAFGLSIALVALMAFAVAPGMCNKPGGLGGENPADESVNKLVERLEENITTEEGKRYKKLEPISYKTQVVAGRNFFIKIKATDENDKVSYIHVRVYEHFRDSPKVQSILRSQSESNPIMHFDP